jgi:WD40 repeat protein
VSPSGRLLLATTDSSAGDAAVFDLVTRSVVHRAPLTANAAVFVDEETFVTTHTMVRRHRIGERDPVFVSDAHGAPIAFNHARGLLALTSRRDESVIDVVTVEGVPTRTIRVPGRVRRLAFDPAGECLAIGCAEQAFVLSFASGALTLVHEHPQAHDVLVAWSGTALVAIAAGARRGVVLTRSQDRHELTLEKDAHFTSTSAFGALAVASMSMITVDPLGREARVSVIGPIGALSFVDAKRLAVGVRDQVRFVDVGTGTIERAKVGHEDGVARIASTSDGAVLATAGTNSPTVHLWAAQSGGHLHTLRGHGTAPSALSFTTEGDLLASTGHDGRLVVHDVATGAEVSAVELGGHARNAAVAFTRGRDLVTASEQGELTVRSLPGLAPLRTLARVPRSGLFEPSLAVSADDRWVAMAVDGEVTVHALDDAESEPFLRFSEEARLPSFAPDASALAFRHDAELVVVEVPSGRELLRLASPVIHSLAFLDDGCVAILPYADDPLEIVEIATRARHVVPLGGRPRAVARAGEGALAVGFADGTAQRVAVPRTATALRRTTLVSLRRTLGSLLPDAETLVGYRDAPVATAPAVDEARITRAGVEFALAVTVDREGWALRIRREPPAAPLAPTLVPGLLDRARAWLGGAVSPLAATLGAERMAGASIEPGGTLVVRGALVEPPATGAELERWLVMLARLP